MLLTPNYRGFVRGSLPLRSSSRDRQEVFAKESSVVDVATGLANACRPASTRARGSSSYVAEVLADPDRTDDFRHSPPSST